MPKHAHYHAPRQSFGHIKGAAATLTRDNYLFKGPLTRAARTQRLKEEMEKEAKINAVPVVHTVSFRFPPEPSAGFSVGSPPSTQLSSLSLSSPPPASAVTALSLLSTPPAKQKPLEVPDAPKRMRKRETDPVARVARQLYTGPEFQPWPLPNLYDKVKRGTRRWQVEFHNEVNARVQRAKLLSTYHPRPSSPFEESGSPEY